MDEKKLQDMLANLHAPEPDSTAKKQALERAMTAFDEKMHLHTQGVQKPGRLTGVDAFFTNVRRWIMQKKYIWSGAVGAVAAVALLAVVGTPYFKDMGTAGTPSSVLTLSQTVGSSAPGAEVPPAYTDAVRTRNAERLEEALAQTGKTIPAPTMEFGKRESDVVVGAEDNDLRRDRLVDRAEEDVKALAAPAPKPAETPVAPAPQGEIAREQMAVSGVGAPSATVDGSISGYRQAPLNQLKPEIAPPMPVIMDDSGTSWYKDQGRDKFQNFEENPVRSVAAEPVSTFSIDVDTASYSFVRRMLNSGVMPQKDAVRIEEMVNYFDYDYALPESKKEPFKPTVAVYDTPWTKGHKIIHVGIRGYDIAEKPKSNLVFLIDTSGSMDSPDKLPLLVNSFRMMLDSLSPDDTVGIVTYAGSAGTVLEPTKAGDKQKIIEVLDRLQSGGSTAGAEGIRQAYALARKAFIKDGNNRIVLATDGDFNVGITNPEELKGFVERKRSEGIYLSVLGFGEGNYNDQMMQALAQNGNGNAAYIDSLNEARKVLVQEAGSTLFTIAKDVKIQVEFNPAMVSEYRLIGYETRHLNREDFNNDTVNAGEVGAGHTVTALYEITPVGATKSVDDLRYGADTGKNTGINPGNGEYAFLKIRWKQPDSDTSTLMTRPITPKDEVKFDAASDDVRFAAAVAGFGELLKGSKHTGSLTYDQVINIANSARGKDEFGYRTEFVN
ncbi:MAG: VWA domain-containing protein, partial [Pseudomonadota bacterium]|nr:VWA domain-containing protein [Pseudomonadota bacterium]